MALAFTSSFIVIAYTDDRITVSEMVGEMLVVYVPMSPNPASGFTIIVHRSKAVKSKMDIEAVTSFIVSVGVDLHQKEELEKLADVSRKRDQS